MTSRRVDPEDRTDVRAILERVGALLTDDHFWLTSRKHSAEYINKDALYPYVEDTSRVCSEFVPVFWDQNVEVVVAPAVGGVILTQWVASAMSMLPIAPRAVYAEKETVELADPEGLDRKCFAETGRFVFGRGYDELVAGRRVLVVEDILTTGGSVLQVVEAVRRLNGEVVGVGALCNRGGVTPDKVGNVPILHALLDVDLKMWDPENGEVCPLCAAGKPINRRFGRGKTLAA